MASEALAEIIAGMRAGGPDFAASPAEARKSFEDLLQTLPVDPDLVFENVEIGGVPALRVATGPADRILFYLHGGGYVVGSANGYRGTAAEIGRAVDATTVIPDYRLAPEEPFPAALDDAVAAYRALLGEGKNSSSIIVAGDSAGGGLAAAMLLKLRDEGDPLPAGAFLLSPWVDLSCTARSFETKQAEDPSLSPESLRSMARHYLGGADAATPYASPAVADLHGLPPLLIHVGSAEILLDDAVRLAGAAGAAGTHVQLEIWPEMIHVWHSFAFMLPEGRRAIDSAGVFLRDLVEA